MTERFSRPLENYSLPVRAAVDLIAKYGDDSVCAIQEAKGRAIRIFSISCPTPDLYRIAFGWWCCYEA
jgi:hypothetical protein